MSYMHRSRVDILTELARHEAALTMRELVDATGIPQSTIRSRLRGLQRRGLVKVYGASDWNADCWGLTVAGLVEAQSHGINVSPARRYAR